MALSAHRTARPACAIRRSALRESFPRGRNSCLLQLSLSGSRESSAIEYCRTSASRTRCLRTVPRSENRLGLPGESALPRHRFAYAEKREERPFVYMYFQIFPRIAKSQVSSDWSGAGGNQDCRSDRNAWAPACIEQPGEERRVLIQPESGDSAESWISAA